MRADIARFEKILALAKVPQPEAPLALMVRELKLLRELQMIVTEYLCHSGRSKQWMSIDTLRQNVALIRKEIDDG